jgi:hypothetical protein
MGFPWKDVFAGAVRMCEAAAEMERDPEAWVRGNGPLAEPRGASKFFTAAQCAALPGEPSVIAAPSMGMELTDWTSSWAVQTPPLSWDCDGALEIANRRHHHRLIFYAPLTPRRHHRCCTMRRSRHRQSVFDKGLSLRDHDCMVLTGTAGFFTHRGPLLRRGRGGAENFLSADCFRWFKLYTCM